MTSRGFGSSGAVPCARRRGARGARLARRANFSSKLAIFLRFNDTGHRTSHHEPPRCKNVSVADVTSRSAISDKTRAHLERERAALVGTDPRRLIWPAAFHIHGQGVCTVDPNGTNLERGASLEPPGRFTNEIGRSSERSKWFRQRAVWSLFLAARPRFYEIIRDHPRSFTSSTWRRSRSPCRPRQ